MRRIPFFLFALLFSTMSLGAQPKYRPQVHPLVWDHAYIRAHAAPNYWRFASFYLAQRNGTSCSLATATMVVNAARTFYPALLDSALATQDEVVARVNNPTWTKGVTPSGSGATLEQLATYLAQAFKAYGITHFSIKTVHTKGNTTATAQRLHHDLLRMETGKSFIIANFDLAAFTPTPSSGHFSPVAAYDAQHKKVLIMDTYRRLYEPYWVPESKFLAAMATKDAKANQYRGYLVIVLFP